MSTVRQISKYLLNEVAAGTVVSGGKGETVGSGAVSGLGAVANDMTDIVVRNKPGKGLRGVNTGFGLGLASTPTLNLFANDLIKKFVPADQRLSDEDRMAETDDPSIPNWQELNRAVGNFVRTKVNQSLEPMEMGQVAEKPAAKYDGFDMTKLGVVTDKKYLKSLGLKLPKYK